MAATDPVQDKVEVPEPPVMLVELKVHDRLVEFVVTARVTAPVKPFTGTTVTVEIPAAPTFALTVVGLAATVKSWKVKVTDVELVVDPLIAATVAVLD